MVRKVVIPAMTSVRTLVLFSLSLKTRSSMLFSPGCHAECAGIGLCKATVDRARRRPDGGQMAGLPLEGSFPTVRRNPKAQRGPDHNEHEPVLSACHQR